MAEVQSQGHICAGRAGAAMPRAMWEYCRQNSGGKSMETGRRQLRKLGDRLAGKTAGIKEPSAEFSLHTHAHRIYAWRERRNRTMMPKQERRQSWSRRDRGERGEVRVAAGEEGWRSGAPWLADTQNLKQGHCLKLREGRREREREGERKEQVSSELS